MTGDIHGWENHRHKLMPWGFPEGATLTRDDFVIICGDVGWGLGEKADLLASWLESRPWTTLFVDGNHESHPALEALPVTRWRGGLVHQCSDHVFHLMRGQVFELPLSGTGEKVVRVFSMGGASSRDKDLRVPGVSWFEAELPTAGEIDAAEAVLDACGWEVDVVITHAQPPEVAQVALGTWGAVESDRLSAWLGYVQDRLAYDVWYSGHLHRDVEVARYRHVVAFDRVRDLASDLIRLASDPAGGVSPD